MKNRDTIVIVCAQTKFKQRSIHFSFFFFEKVFFGREIFAFILPSLSADFLTQELAGVVLLSKLCFVQLEESFSVIIISFSKT